MEGVPCLSFKMLNFISSTSMSVHRMSVFQATIRFKNRFKEKTKQNKKNLNLLTQEGVMTVKYAKSIAGKPRDTGA